MYKRQPLFFGKYKQAYIFGLPGNPASTLTCFYLYAFPMLRSYYNHPTPHLIDTQRKLKNNFKVKGDRPQFLKAYCDGHNITVLPNQSSSMIHGFNNANCLAFFEEGNKEVISKTTIKTILLPI